MVAGGSAEISRTPCMERVGMGALDVNLPGQMGGGFI